MGFRRVSELVDEIEGDELTEWLGFELTCYREEWERTGKQCETAWSVGLIEAASRGAKVKQDDFRTAEFFGPSLAAWPKAKRKRNAAATEPATAEPKPRASGLECWMRAMANPQLWKG